MDAAASVSGERSLPATVYAMGFSLRKRPMLRRFLPECAVRFVKSVEEVPPGATLATWGLGGANVDRSRNEVVRIEDGFLRSVGLGAELVAPLSWTIDTAGIYFDASRPSDLEQLLEQGSFGAGRSSGRSPACGNRQRRATKYNVGGRTWKRPATTKRVILVPGQVERDDSIVWARPTSNAISTCCARLEAAVPRRTDL